MYTTQISKKLCLVTWARQKIIRTVLPPSCKMRRYKVTSSEAEDQCLLGDGEGGSKGQRAGLKRA